MTFLRPHSSALAENHFDPYAPWAPRYPPRAHNLLMEVEQAAMCELLPRVDGLRVLDAGCGTGRYARIVRARGARHVVGVDLSASMLAHASRADAQRVRGDIRALPVASGAFDLIVSGLMLPDIADLAEVAREWRRVLRPGGVVVCSTLHPRGADLGWTRTFETPHGTYTLPAHWHTVGDHDAAYEAAGLVIESYLEPCLHWGTAGGARRAGVPVALVIRAQRPR